MQNAKRNPLLYLILFLFVLILALNVDWDTAIDDFQRGFRDGIEEAQPEGKAPAE